MVRSMASGALVLVALAGSAVGQAPPPIATVRIDDGAVRHRSEMALRASPSTFDIIAAWHEHYSSTGNAWVYYNVATNGLNFRTNPGRVPLPAS